MGKWAAHAAPDFHRLSSSNLWANINLSRRALFNAVPFADDCGYGQTWQANRKNYPPKGSTDALMNANDTRARLEKLE